MHIQPMPKSHLPFKIVPNFPSQPCAVSKHAADERTSLMSKPKPPFRPLTLLLLAIVIGCNGNNTIEETEPPQVTTYLFSDVTTETGLEFNHVNGFTGVYYLSEIMGSGVALFDFDNDGDLDLYQVQSHDLDPANPHRSNTIYKDRLFRNDLSQNPQGDEVIKWVDVTEESNIQAFGYGMGVAAADYDNDGHIDLYITNLGDNQLYRNLGDGTFEDVTAAANANDPLWSVSASWVDFDRDGFLDLYIGNFSNFYYDNNRQCFGANRDYCSPLSYDPQLDTLLRNKGDGTFENVSEAAGIHKATGRALGVIAADFNNDQWPDIYVANDSSANQLWINQKDGSFQDTAMLSGSALNQTGMPEASMGVDAADFDGDGDEDLFMTHLGNQTNTIYVNDGNGWFEDLSNLSGLGTPSLPFTGFGTAWFDFDNDTFLDLLIANGAVKRPELVKPTHAMAPYKQRNQLFRNLGDGKFTEITTEAGPAFTEKEVSRAAAFGDVDNDGDQDVIITNNAGPTRFLLNNTGQRVPWLGFRLLNHQGRDALGAKIRMTFSRGPAMWRRCRTDGSYASSNDPRLTIGLGKRGQPKSLQVFWPDGSVELFPVPKVREYHSLQQGKGEIIE